jgi:ubiquinone/menaquinone biosynthesis C-methylase UbiE
MKINWYDKIAKYYDFFTTLVYKKSRMKLVNNLEINKGDRVLIIACGTGQNFKLIREKIGNNGEIIAVDYSKEMLKVAQRRIIKNNWKNIKLINVDVRNLSAQYLANNHIRPDFDILIGELAFSVIPEWKDVMRVSASLLKENAKIGLLDWYRRNNDWLTKIVDYLAEAETNRNTIEFAKKIFVEFTVINKFFFNNVYIGIGRMKTKAQYNT